MIQLGIHSLVENGVPETEVSVHLHDRPLHLIPGNAEDCHDSLQTEATTKVQTAAKMAGGTLPVKDDAHTDGRFNGFDDGLKGLSKLGVKSKNGGYLFLSISGDTLALPDDIFLPASGLFRLLEGLRGLLLRLRSDDVILDDHGERY